MRKYNVLFWLCGLSLFWIPFVFANEPRVIYPKKTDLNFEGLDIEGEFRNPGEFYFKIREEEKFDSLIKRRKNFRREMLRDVVLSR